MATHIDPEKFTESNHPALYYQDMLADHRRMHRYRQAINRVVQPGDVVADLGTGLGVLALMAYQAGASRVYAVDNRPRSLWLAEQIVQANGAGDRVQLVEGDVREVCLSEPVDVIVNELIGDFGTDESIHECVSAFAKNNLKTGGRILPSHLQTFLVPVEYADEYRGVWCDDHHGLNLSAAIDYPCRPEAVMYGLRQRPRELAAAVLMEDIFFNAEMDERDTTIATRFAIAEQGVLQGFVGYFRAKLCEGVELNNYPCYAGCHWENWHWPVSPPRPVIPGQHIEATLLARSNMVAAGWTMDWNLP